MIILNDETIQTVEIGAKAMVRNPATDSFVEVIVEDGSAPFTADFNGFLVLTTTDSNFDPDGLSIDNYTSRIRHLRAKDFTAAMSREHIADLLKSGEYSIG